MGSSGGGRRSRDVVDGAGRALPGQSTGQVEELRRRFGAEFAEQFAPPSGHPLQAPKRAARKLLGRMRENPHRPRRAPHRTAPDRPGDVAASKAAASTTICWRNHRRPSTASQRSHCYPPNPDRAVGRGVLLDVGAQAAGAISADQDVGWALALDGHLTVPSDHDRYVRRGLDVAVLARGGGGIKMISAWSVTATPTRAAWGAPSGPRVANTASPRWRINDTPRFGPSCSLPSGSRTARETTALPSRPGVSSTRSRRPRPRAPDEVVGRQPTAVRGQARDAHHWPAAKLVECASASSSCSEHSTSGPR